MSWRIEVWTDQIEVTSNMPRPDPAWRHTDANGHDHWYQSDTFRWVVDEPGNDDWPDEGHYECIRCGEHVHPGSIRPSMFREYIPGMVHAEATHTDGRRIDLNAEQIERLRTATTIEEVLGD